jgi:rRNA maturation endonuclease Nob1
MRNMFKKKIQCARCGKKIDKDFDFCPYCGYSLKPSKVREKQFKDFQREFDKSVKMPFVMKFPLKQLMKQFEKQIDAQMREIDKNLDKQGADKKNMPRISGLSISISSDGEGKPMIKVGQLGKPQRIMTPEERAEETAEKLTEQKKARGKRKEDKEKETKMKMSKAKAKKYSKLPKAEPETKVRRLTDRVVYEIALPGVKSIKDVVLNKLDNSIEIKAFSKDKAYFKLIPIALPIKKYSLDQETLVLELIP